MATEILFGLIDAITMEIDDTGKSQFSIHGSLIGSLILSQVNKKPFPFRKTTFNKSPWLRGQD
ncbi:MAG: hypothetical protein ACU0CA_07335 [Paracoccaceae bacterium]